MTTGRSHDTGAPGCAEALETVEAVAAGDMAPSPELTAHFASCAGCAAALEDARRVERLLEGRTVPQPPPQFTMRVMARVRRERWRTEQALDIGFNLVLVLLFVIVVGSAWLLIHRSGLALVSRDAADLVSSEAAGITRRAAASLPLYGAATALLAGALAIWWWAEREII